MQPEKNIVLKIILKLKKKLQLKLKENIIMC